MIQVTNRIGATLAAAMRAAGNQWLSIGVGAAVWMFGRWPARRKASFL
tara:strand:- start:310 stop:453 length:144 start_codon:yes stop_codon:yes gene_type:complete